MFFEGVIASAPDADRRVTVTIPAFDPEQTFGPCPYMPRGDAVPTVDAKCLVWLDESGIQQPWVVAWDGPDSAATLPYTISAPFAVASASMTMGAEDTQNFVHNLNIAGQAIVVGHLEDGSWAHACGWRVTKIDNNTLQFKFRNGHTTSAAQAVLKFRLIY